MTTMLAGRLTFEPRSFRVEEVPVPTPGPDEVRIRVKAAGVCLSDVHLIDGSLTPRFNPQPAVTLGHEVSGVIDLRGPGVPDTWAEGTRVALQAGRVCGGCANCRRRRRPCLQIRTRGVDYDGGWAEYALARQDTLVAIPDSLPFDQAAIVPDAVSTPYAALVETGAVRPAQAVGLWGVGGLGAHAVRIARMIGAFPILALDPLPSARARAVEYGADVVLDPDDEGWAASLREATAGRGLDVAFDFAGVPAVREQAAKALGLGGVLVLVGITPGALSLRDSVRFIVAGHQVRGHYGSEPEHVEQLIALAAAGRLDLAPSISGHLPLAEAAEAVRRLEEKEGDPVRLVLVP